MTASLPKSPGLFSVFWPMASITIDITITFMFHNFFNSLTWSRHLSLFSHSLIFFSPVVSQNGQIHYSAGSLFFFFFSFLTITWPGQD